MLRKYSFLMLAITLGLVLVCAELLITGRSQAAGTMVGCPPETLRVQTGQGFYFTFVISDVVDLYAWQSDFTFNPDNLEFKRVVYADFLVKDQVDQYTQAPVASSGGLTALAATRLNSG